MIHLRHKDGCEVVAGSVSSARKGLSEEFGTAITPRRLKHNAILSSSSCSPRTTPSPLICSSHT